MLWRLWSSLTWLIYGGWPAYRVTTIPHTTSTPPHTHTPMQIMLLIGEGFDDRGARSRGADQRQGGQDCYLGGKQ